MLRATFRITPLQGAKAAACLAAMLVSAQSLAPAFAWTLPDIPRPQTAGQWAQVYTPVSEVQGTYGTGEFGDAIHLQAKEGLILVDAALLEKLKKEQGLQFKRIRLQETNTTVGDSADLGQFENTELDMAAFNRMAQHLVSADEAKKHLYKVQFSEEAGELLVEVEPVRIGELKVEGNQRLRTSAIKRQLGLKSDAVLDTQALEKALRFLQATPEVRVEASLEPVAGTALVDVCLKVEESRALHATQFWNNLDQVPYGGMLTGTSIIHNNVTGNSDSLIVTAMTDPRVHGAFVHYDVPVNKHGTRLAVDYSNLRTKPGTTGSGYEDFDMRGRFAGLTTSVLQPIVAKEGLRISADANVDVRNSKSVSKLAVLDTDGDGNDEVYTDTELEKQQLRSLRFGVNFSKAMEGQELSSRQEISVGMPIFGASLNNADSLGNGEPGGGSQFFRYTGSYNYVKSLPKETVLSLAAITQWSPGTLPDAEVGAIGGTYYGRGYQEGYMQADSYLFGSAEFRTPFFLVPKGIKLPKTQDDIRDKVNIVSFVDYGMAYMNDRNLTSDHVLNVVSTGVGLRADISEWLTARVDVAMPLVNVDGYSGHGPRAHFGLIFKPF